MKPMTPRSIRSTIAAVLLCPFLTGSLSYAAVSTYTEGHADLGVGYEDGELHFHFHGEGAVIDGVVVEDAEYDAADIIIVGGAASALVLPEFFDMPGLGKSAGDTIFVLPWNQEAGLPFLGTASEELDTGDWTGGITFTLGNVVSPSGSGAFAMWRYSSFGEVMLDVSSLTGPDAVTTFTGSHDHYNWGFTEPGLWEIELTASGTHVTDGFKSDTQVFRFQIIPEPASAALAVLGAAGILIRRRR